MALSRGFSFKSLLATCLLAFGLVASACGAMDDNETTSTPRDTAQVSSNSVTKSQSEFE